MDAAILSLNDRCMNPGKAFLVFPESLVLIEKQVALRIDYCKILHDLDPPS